MGRPHSRPRAFALAVLTCFALFGAAPAFASGQPKVNGSGWYFNFFNQEVKIGITAKYSGNMVEEGRFDFFIPDADAKNVQGRITSWEPMENACGPGVEPPFFGPPAGAPGATLHGVCDHGANCTFDINVVDGGNKKGSDWVCLVKVMGTDKRGVGIMESQDPPQPLFKGNIEIKNSQ